MVRWGYKLQLRNALPVDFHWILLRPETVCEAKLGRLSGVANMPGYASERSDSTVSQQTDSRK